jgi:hypothetical protein
MQHQHHWIKNTSLHLRDQGLAILCFCQASRVLKGPTLFLFFYSHASPRLASSLRFLLSFMHTRKFSSIASLLPTHNPVSRSLDASLQFLSCRSATAKLLSRCPISHLVAPNLSPVGTIGGDDRLCSGVVGATSSTGPCIPVSTSARRWSAVLCAVVTCRASWNHDAPRLPRQRLGSFMGMVAGGRRCYQS